MALAVVVVQGAKHFGVHQIHDINFGLLPSIIKDIFTFQTCNVTLFTLNPILREQDGLFLILTNYRCFINVIQKKARRATSLQMFQNACYKNGFVKEVNAWWSFKNVIAT